MISHNTVIERNPKVAYRGLSEESGGVLLHLDTANYHSVNQVGAVVWDVLQQSKSFDELVAAVRERFDDSPPSLEAELAEFIDELGTRDLIVVRDQQNGVE